MLNIRKILVPLALANTAQHVVHQAAWWARRFHAEVVLLHVATPFGYPVDALQSGRPVSAQELQVLLVQKAQRDLDEASLPELDGLSVTRLLLEGDPAQEIVRTARERNVDLIAMSTRGHGPFYRFLLGSVTAKVLHESPCPIWTGVHLEEMPVREFSIRHVLCSVDLGAHSRHTVSLAAEMAAAVDATLTLVHVTAGVETFGPGGSYIDPEWKDAVVGFATTEIAKLQQDVGTEAEVIVDSGNVTERLNRAAEQTKADVLVIGHFHGRSHFGDNGNGYEIIRESVIPVLSV